VRKALASMECQLKSLGSISSLVTLQQRIWQRIKKLRRTDKLRRDYIKNLTKELVLEREKKSMDEATMKAGDVVRVRAKKEIQETLDRWNQLQGCAFMEEMWPYCETTQKVLKRVERFLDERDYLVKKCKGIVLLENVSCQGTKDFGQCDRSCFYFWREEWLEKIENGEDDLMKNPV
jgi:hypothetical protein